MKPRSYTRTINVTASLDTTEAFSLSEFTSGRIVIPCCSGASLLFYESDSINGTYHLCSDVGTSGIVPISPSPSMPQSIAIPSVLIGSRYVKIVIGWLSGWSYRMPIAISPANVDALLSHFSLLVPLATTDLLGADSGGADVRFTASDGTTELDYIFDGWTDNNRAGNIVDITEIFPDGETYFYVYWGNDSASDDSSSDAVSDHAVFWPGYGWSSGQLELANDLPITTNYGTPVATSSGVDLNGNSCLKIGTVANDIWNFLNGATGATVSVVLRNINWPSSDQNAIITSNSSYIPPWIQIDLLSNGNIRIFIKPNADSTSTILYATGIVAGNDVHISITLQYQSSLNTRTLSVYVNGSLITTHSVSDTSSVIAASDGSSIDFKIGNNQWSLDAIFSHVCIKREAMPPEEIKFLASNLMNAGNEITLGDQESVNNTMSLLLKSA